MSKILYYHMPADATDSTEIEITPKDYFDEYGCLNDGWGDDYSKMCEALYKSGAEETCESVFECQDGFTWAQVFANMGELGYYMQTNDKFSGFLDSCNKCSKDDDEEN